MVPSRPTEQRKATAAAPRAGSGQPAPDASPEALFWHFVCDEICEVLCEVLCDDTERGAGTLTASAASTLKRRRAEDAATKLRTSESKLAATALAKSSLEVSFAELTSYLNDTRKALATLQAELEDKIAAHRTRAREAAASEAAAKAALEAETERASKETSEANKRCEEGEFLSFNACMGNWNDVVFF